MHVISREIRSGAEVCCTRRVCGRGVANTFFGRSPPGTFLPGASFFYKVHPTSLFSPRQRLKKNRSPQEDNTEDITTRKTLGMAHDSIYISFLCIVKYKQYPMRYTLCSLLVYHSICQVMHTWMDRAILVAHRRTRRSSARQDL